MRFPRSIINVCTICRETSLMSGWQKVVLVVKVLNISTLFLNYVLNELPSISKQKLAWRKFGGTNDFDCPCGKAYCSREVVVCVCVLRSKSRV